MAVVALTLSLYRGLVVAEELQIPFQMDCCWTTVNPAPAIEKFTLFDPVLCSERADGLRVTDRHRYNAANHFSMSVMGGRRVISPGPEDILMTRRVCPSSP